MVFLRRLWRRLRDHTLDDAESAERREARQNYEYHRMMAKYWRLMASARREKP